MIKNVILVTHNARMRCFLEDVIKEKMNSYRSVNNVHEIRFKNSSILLLRIRNNTTELSLVYDGIVNNPKPGAYFVSKPVFENNSKIKYIVFENVLTNMNLDINFDQNYDIYIIRHGEATHNKQKLNLNRDTNLTKDGIEQAEYVTNFFNKFDKIDYFFSSSLIRTRETMEHIIKGLDSKIYNNKQLIVLPCAHELFYNKAGACDKNASYKPVPPENIMKCSTTIVTCKNNDYCCKTPSMQIDWSYYNEFYKSKKKCRNTNMIQLLISYIEKEMNDKYYNKYIIYKSKYLNMIYQKN
jgi:broad specificity phosphatase PhoE